MHASVSLATLWQPPQLHLGSFVGCSQAGAPSWVQPAPVVSAGCSPKAVPLLRLQKTDWLPFALQQRHPLKLTLLCAGAVPTACVFTLLHLACHTVSHPKFPLESTMCIQKFRPGSAQKSYLLTRTETNVFLPLSDFTWVQM